MSPASTEQRLDHIEQRLDELDALLQYLMTLAAKHPLGRKVLKAMAKAGRDAG